MDLTNTSSITCSSIENQELEGKKSRHKRYNVYSQLARSLWHSTHQSY